jgi:hypothetical protein
MFHQPKLSNLEPGHGIEKTMGEDNGFTIERTRRNDAVTDDGGEYTLRASVRDYDYSSREHNEYLPGDFRFLPSSQPQAQDGPVDWNSEHVIDYPRNRDILDDSSRVPERFR